MAEENPSQGPNRLLISVLIFGTLVISLLLLAICVIIIFFIFINSSSDEGISHEIYRIQEINPSQNATTSGFVEIGKKLGDEDYLSYSSSESGHYFFITKFDGNDYSCTGSCVCNPIQRRLTTVLNRGLFLLISAFSTGIALQMAEEAFRYQCERQYSDICDPSEITSEVNECTLLSQLRDTSQYHDETKESKKKTKSKKVSRASRAKVNSEYFTCAGKCVPNKLAQSPIARSALEEFEKKHPCNQHKYVSNVKVNRGGRAGSPIVMLNVQQTFLNYHLSAWCKGMSQRKFFPDPQSQESVLVSWCVAYNDEDEAIRNYQENVKCFRDTLSTIGGEKVSSDYYEYDEGKVKILE